MGEWSDAMEDGVICEGCFSFGDTKTCGCPESQEILRKRRMNNQPDGGATEDAIFNAIRNPYGKRENNR